MIRDIVYVMAGEEYSWAFQYISQEVLNIVEVGSRDGLDAIALARKFKAQVTSFECDPRQFEICVLNVASNFGVEGIVVVRNEALSNLSGETTFWQVEQSKYENPGAGSLFELNFDNRSNVDPDKGLGSVQSAVLVQTRRFDELEIPTPQLLVMDVQGAELKVLQGFGESLTGVIYVVLEVEPVSSYEGGCSMREILRFMRNSGFTLMASDIEGSHVLRLRIHLLLRLVKTALRERTFYPHRIHQGIINLLFERVTLKNQK